MGRDEKICGILAEEVVLNLEEKNRRYIISQGYFGATPSPVIMQYL